MKAAHLRKVKLEESRVAIIGGAGSIGSAVARVLAEKAKVLTLTGRNKENLNKIFSELKKNYKGKITATTNNQEAIKDADIVIFDPDLEWTVSVYDFASKSKNSCFLNERLKGKVIKTLYRGTVVYSSD